MGAEKYTPEEETPRHNVPECALWLAVVQRLYFDLLSDIDGARRDAYRDMRRHREYMKHIVFDCCGFDEGEAEKVWAELVDVASKYDYCPAYNEQDPTYMSDQLWQVLDDKILAAHDVYWRSSRPVFWLNVYRNRGLTRGAVLRYMSERRRRQLPPLPRRADDRSANKHWSPWLYYLPRKGRGEG